MTFTWKSPRIIAPSNTRARLMRYGVLTPEDLGEDEPDSELGELKSTDPDYSPAEIEAAKLMVDQAVRRFVLRLAKVRKMPSQEVENETVDGIVEQLLDI